MQLFVYEVFKIILFRDFINYNYPIKRLLMLYMFTCKSYVIPPPPPFPVRLTILSFLT